MEQWEGDTWNVADPCPIPGTTRASSITATARHLSLAYRAKLGMLSTVSKLRGQVKNTGYPQTEGLLGDCMLKYGHELGDDSSFGECLKK